MVHTLYFERKVNSYISLIVLIPIQYVSIKLQTFTGWLLSYFVMIKKNLMKKQIFTVVS